MTLSAGDRIGPYEVRDRVGSGGMGEVYRARDPKLERDIAVKILPADYAADPDHLRRFEQEARAASALNHPNIITIHEIGMSDSRAYIAMELVEGESLRSIGARRDVGVKSALRIAVKTAEGLAAAHERGIIHRDLKPENIMVSREGFVKILDFGLAKLSRPVTSTDVTLEATTPGLIFGTIAYMSPEQASGKRTDFRSDQFSFGVLLYELLARQHPFQRGSAAETLAAILREDPPPLHAVDASLPPELSRVVGRCLAKEMEDRYASTRDLARDLREVRETLTRPGHTSDRPRSSPSLPPVRPRRNVVAALALSAALLGLVAYMAVRSREPRATAGTAGPVKTVAVALFRDHSGTPDGSMLVEGVSASISARLARARELRVISPAEDAEFSQSGLEELARKRGADLVLRGDVRRQGEQLRIGYRIVEAKSGVEIAGDTVTGTQAELFSLEDRIATSILSALEIRPPASSPQPRLSGPDQQKLLEATGLLHRTGDSRSVDLAIERLEELLINARDSALVNGLLGRAYLFSYRSTRKPALLEQATLYAERGVQLDPALPDAQVTVGELYLTLGRNADAETAFRRTLELRRDDPGAILGLADTYDALGRAAEAEAHYERVLKLVPGWPTAYSRYGRFCFSRGRYEKAVEVFSTLGKLVPRSPRPFTNLGAAYQALGRYDEAIRSYQRAIALGPTASAWSNMGVAQYALGRFDDAAHSFEKALELAPDNYLLWANAGDAFRWSKERSRAASFYERAVALGRKDLGINPGDALVRAVVASSLAKLGRTAEAKKEADKALRANPTDGTVLYHAAVTSAIREEADAALLWLRRAVDAGYMADDARRDPEFAMLRNRPEFGELLRHSGAEAKEKR